MTDKELFDKKVVSIMNKVGLMRTDQMQQMENAQERFEEETAKLFVNN